MLVQHKQMDKKGMFFIAAEDDEPLAELIYNRQDDGSLMIEHTHVDDELRGQNVGYQLVQTAVDYAKTHNLKIIPLCPFAKAVIDKKPEWKDVLKEE